MKNIKNKALIISIITLCILSLSGYKSGFFGFLPDNGGQTELNISNDLAENKTEDESAYTAADAPSVQNDYDDTYNEDNENYEDNESNEDYESDEDYENDGDEETGYSDDIIVYRTATGECYHSYGCQYLKSCIKLTLRQAEGMGLRACSRCFSP